jgi:hypothetical protein
METSTPIVRVWAAERRTVGEVLHLWMAVNAAAAGPEFFVSARRRATVRDLALKKDAAANRAR